MGQLEPAREEILDAFEALHSLTEFAILHSADWKEEGEMRKCCVRIIQALPEKPRPTMAEIEWDEEEHFLAEAEDEHGIRMIMVSDELDFIRCMQPPSAGGIVLGVPKKDLTPTGRRYVLQEGE